MYKCPSLYFLSTIACKLSECLTQEELEILSADLSTLGDMLASISARKSANDNEPQTSCADTADESTTAD